MFRQSYIFHFILKAFLFTFLFYLLFMLCLIFYPCMYCMYFIQYSLATKFLWFSMNIIKNAIAIHEGEREIEFKV